MKYATPEISNCRTKQTSKTNESKSICCNAWLWKLARGMNKTPLTCDRDPLIKVAIFTEISHNVFLRYPIPTEPFCTQKISCDM